MHSGHHFIVHLRHKDNEVRCDVFLWNLMIKSIFLVVYAKKLNDFRQQMNEKLCIRN